MKNQHDIKVCVVIPCFNEAKNISAVCKSLGFGIGKTKIKNNNTLFIVDNNSTDNTYEILKDIRKNSKAGSVIIGKETVQGFIPARERGNLMVLEFCKRKHLLPENILIVQADADTIYSKGYLDAMKKESLTSGENTMLQACISYLPSFRVKYSKYLQMCERIDNRYNSFSPGQLDDDIIIDDKVAAYRLSDYFKWGGYIREYTSRGDEIYSETSRLFIRSKIKNAKRRMVDTFAFHSARKIVANPLLSLATAGFPHERFNLEQLKAIYQDHLPLDLRNFNLKNHKIKRAAKQRELHILTLLTILPYHVAVTLDKKTRIIPSQFAAFLRTILPKRKKADLKNRPGVFFLDSIDAMNNFPEEISNQAYQLLRRGN